jgi:hypothetical protein
MVYKPPLLPLTDLFFSLLPMLMVAKRQWLSGIKKPESRETHRVLWPW